MGRFTIGREHFELDGDSFQIISGAMHYFRIHPDLWEDRIAQAKAMGLNTIETYVAWNFHAPERGRFDTSGRRDLERYLRLINDAGMYAIQRPRPFICAEWENGGFPAWLMSVPGIELRRTNGPYLQAVQEYFDALLPIITAQQIGAGGPVILVQVENEYGAYGQDKEYLRALTEMLRAGGVQVPVFTCDQADDEMLQRGGLPERHKTATFGSPSLERFEVLRRHQPTGSLMCMEFWNGWFDAWGQDHHVTDPEESARELDQLLGSRASVNFYMVHGARILGGPTGRTTRAPTGPPSPPTTTTPRSLRTAPRPRSSTPSPASSTSTPAGTSRPWPPAPRHRNCMSPGRLHAPRCGTSSTPAPLGAASTTCPPRRSWAPPRVERVPVPDRSDRVRGDPDRGGGPGPGPGVLQSRPGRHPRPQPRRTHPHPARGRRRCRDRDPRGRPGPGQLRPPNRGGEGSDRPRPSRRRSHPWGEAAWLDVDAWASEFTSPAGVPSPEQAPAPEDGSAPLAGHSLPVWEVEVEQPSDLFLDTTAWGKGPQQTLDIPAPTVRPGVNRLVVCEPQGGAGRGATFASGPRWANTTAD